MYIHVHVHVHPVPHAIHTDVCTMTECTIIMPAAEQHMLIVLMDMYMYMYMYMRRIKNKAIRPVILVWPVLYTTPAVEQPQNRVRQCPSRRDRESQTPPAPGPHPHAVSCSWCGYAGSPAALREERARRRGGRDCIPAGYTAHH